MKRRWQKMQKGTEEEGKTGFIKRRWQNMQNMQKGTERKDTRMYEDKMAKYAQRNRKEEGSMKRKWQNMHQGTERKKKDKDVGRVDGRKCRKEQKGRRKARMYAEKSAEYAERNQQSDVGPIFDWDDPLRKSEGDLPTYLRRAEL